MADGVSYPPATAESLGVPLPASAMPPGVSDSGSVGTASPYARSDHTHASKARKEIKGGATAGVFTWVYPTPFSPGVVPVCQALAVCPAGTTALVNVQQEGDATNTQASFRVTVYQQSVVALIGLTILSTGAIPANVKISLIALEP